MKIVAVFHVGWFQVHHIVRTRGLYVADQEKVQTHKGLAQSVAAVQSIFEYPVSHEDAQETEGKFQK